MQRFFVSFELDCLVSRSALVPLTVDYLECNFIFVAPYGEHCLVYSVLVAGNLFCNRLSKVFVGVILAVFFVVEDEQIFIRKILCIVRVYWISIVILIFSDPCPSEELGTFFYRFRRGRDFYRLIDTKISVFTVFSEGFISIILIPVDMCLFECACAILVVDSRNCDLTCLCSLIIVFDEIFYYIKCIVDIIGPVAYFPANESVSILYTCRRCSENYR